MKLSKVFYTFAHIPPDQKPVREILFSVSFPTQESIPPQASHGFPSTITHDVLKAVSERGSFSVLSHDGFSTRKAVPILSSRKISPKPCFTVAMVRPESSTSSRIKTGARESSCSLCRSQRQKFSGIDPSHGR
jgi:hypothetical protein